MFYHFKIHKEGKSYWAECLELEGCFTEADTLEDLKKNMEVALNLHLAEPMDSKTIFPLPSKKHKGRNIEVVPVAHQIAFAFMVRRCRLQHHWTQKHVAQLLGKKLFSYQKLENPKTANPQWSTLVELKKVAFPELKLDDLIAT